MKILVINCGSSSLKYQLINMENEEVLAKGLCERIGIQGSVLKHQPGSGEKVVIEKPMPTHTEAIQSVIDALIDSKHGVIKSMSEINAVGHRVVHAGEKFASSVVLTQAVKDALNECIDLAPLHNPPNIIGIEACEKLMPGVPMVGVFDTAFHQTMPKEAYIYALPYEMYEKYKIRRYGFHGTSHRYVSEKAAEFLGKPISELKLVTCHLGNGASLAAVKYGFVLQAAAAAVAPSWTEGAVESGGRLTDAIQAWVLLPEAPGRLPQYAYVALVAGVILVTRLRGWPRLLTLAPVLYLTAFVWENLMIQQPAVSRLVLFGALLVVLMQVRPQGLLGTARVEIV